MLLATEMIGHIAYYYLHDGISLMKMRAGHETRFSPYGLYKFSPNIKTIYDELETDQFGFIHNGREESIKEEDYTIFILGGSTVAGLGSTSNNHTLVAQMEKKLRKRKGVFESARVVNVGTTAYVSHQERIRLDAILAQYKPNLVIALDGFNDAFIVSTWGGRGWRPYWQPQYTIGTQEIRSALEGAPIIHRVKKALLKNSTIYNGLIYVVLPETARNPGAINFLNQKVVTDTTIRAAVSAYENNHVLMQKICHLHGVEYMGVLQPTLTASLLKPHKSPEEKTIVKQWILNFQNPEAYYPTIEKFYMRSSRLEKQHNWFYDLSKMFAEEKETLYLDTCHYNDLANELIADHLVELIEKSNEQEIKDE